MTKEYVKIIGLKFDALEGLEVVQDANREDLVSAAEFAQEQDDKNTIWVAIPCTCIIWIYVLYRIYLSIGV